MLHPTLRSHHLALEEQDSSFLHQAVASLSVARGCENWSCSPGTEELPAAGPGRGAMLVMQEGGMQPRPHSGHMDTALKKTTARGSFLIGISGWYTGEPGSGNKT